MKKIKLMKKKLNPWKLLKVNSKFKHKSTNNNRKSKK